MLTRARPELWELPTRTGTTKILATLLGEGTSRSDVHSHLDDVAAPGQKCSACRWSEVKIFRLPEVDGQRGDYVVHTAGRSAIPGEFTKTRLVRTASPRAVIDALIVQRYEDGELRDTFITRPAQDALDAATDQDDDLGEALDEWMEDPANADLLR